MAVTAVILVGHGAPATDTPPYLVLKLKQLAAKRRALSMTPTDEELEIDRKIRSWPRTEDNDPYRRGLLAIADEVRRAAAEDVLVRVAFCEFCEPTLPEAVAECEQAGAARVVVIPSMVTSGGVHSESDIPRMLDEIRATTAVEIVYAWPFDPGAVAGFLLQSLAPHGIARRPG